MLPRLGSSKLVSAWIWVTVFASIALAVDGGSLTGWLAFSPSRIWQGEVWRLATWVFVAPGPVSLVLTCASLYKCGGELAPRWGDRRLRRFMVEVIGGASVVTMLLALINEAAWDTFRFGGWVVCDALVIAWVRQYPQSTIELRMVHWVLRLRGQTLIAVVIGSSCLFAVVGRPFAMAPELLVCAAALWYPSARLMRSA